MIIDAHNHPDWHGHDLAAVLANMDAHGIATTWLLSWECPSDEYDPNFDRVSFGRSLGAPEGTRPIPFSRCLHYKEQASDRFVLGYAPDPRRPGAEDTLRTAVDLYGVQVFGELKLRMCYDSPDALRLFRVCGELGLPVTVHIDYEFARESAYPRPNYWYGGGLAAFERALIACPETMFLGHAPGFWAHISGDGLHNQIPYPRGAVVPGGRLPELFRRCPNLHGDLSAGSGLTAISRDPGFGREFILEFQDRLLFARDSFDNRLQEFLVGLDLPSDVLAKLYADNARRLAPLPS